MDSFKKHTSLFYILTSVAKDLPIMFAIDITLTILDGLQTPLMIIVISRFIDYALRIGSSSYQQDQLVLYGACIILVYAYTIFSSQLKTFLSKSSEDALMKKLKPRMIKKIYTIDYLIFESSDTQDLIHRVTENSHKRFISIQKTVLSLIKILIQVVGTIIAIAPYMGWYVLLIFAMIILLLLVVSKGGQRVYTSEKKVAIITRKMNYLSEVLTSREASHERTLFGYTDSLNKKYKDAHLFRSNYNTKALAREVSRSKGINILLNMMIVGLLVHLMRAVSVQTLTIGMFTSITGSVILLSKTLSGQLSNLFLYLAADREYAKDLHAFASLAEHSDGKGSVTKIGFETLVIKDLFFKYPDCEGYVLKGINLKLKRGMSYSLVGINGAGKTTLIKILTGLYRHYEGSILLDGIELRDYSYEQLRQVFSVVSQDFAKYSISVEDNITFGRPNNDVENALKSLELDTFIGQLPSKEKTMLGKLSDKGVDLSGGEWQKLAIARAMFRQTPFVILDEPTSSLSPTAESDIYTKFMDFAEGRSLLMISHRLGSTKIADEIIVMHDGKIAESGSHDYLMKLRQHYATLFEKQSRLYNEKN